LAQTEEQRPSVAVIGLRGFPGVQGGIETHCEHLYPRLVKRGFDVTVYARSPYVGVNSYVHEGVQVVPLPTLKVKGAETVLHTRCATNAALRERPALVHYHAIGPSLMVPMAKRSGAKVVATHHGFDYERKRWGPMARALLRWGQRRMRSADAVIAVSKHIAEALSASSSCPVYAIPNGVSPASPTKPGETLRRFGLAPRRYFLFVGRLVPEKGLDDLVAAFSDLESDWGLAIVGGADHEDSYSRGLRARCGKAGVTLTGPQKGKTLAELYSNAGCFVLPSHHEGLPIVLLEALGYGLPCIASDIPPNRAVEHDSVHLFPAGDDEALAARMRDACRGAHDKEFWSAVGWVKKHFSWDMVAGRTAEVYRQVLHLA
jgi:glycosyltransferase involved in cell wall biosynthesis